jgi:hypothetical protein
MSQIFEPLFFTVPLSFEAHAIARQHQRQQSLPDKSKQVYLNALAVYAVNFYLCCLGFEVEPESSDYLHSWVAKFLDIADLSLKQIGKLECRLVMPDTEILQIPPDAWTDRIGYVAVQLDKTLKSATLLGFTQAPAAEIPLTELRSLAELPEYLHQLRKNALTNQPAASFDKPTSSSQFTASDNKLVSPSKTVNLRVWLEGVFELEWQPMEEALGSDRMRSIAVRNSTQLQTGVKRAKLIDVGMQLGEQSVILSIAIISTADDMLNILVQIYPGPNIIRVPPNLKLIMLSGKGEVLQQICSRDQDNYIQLRHFHGQAGDQFSIQVILDDVGVTESFVL